MSPREKNRMLIEARLQQQKLRIERVLTGISQEDFRMAFAQEMRGRQSHLQRMREHLRIAAEETDILLGRGNSRRTA